MLFILQVKDIVDSAFKAPIASLLVVVGVIFLGIAVVGNTKYFRPGKQGRKMSGFIGGILVLLGVGMHIFGSSGSAETNVAGEFIKNRPNSDSGKTVQNAQYKLKTASLQSETSHLALLGITIWRLRTSTSEDAGPRYLVQDNSQLTPERLEADTQLHTGDKLFFSVESTVNGYLYVLDREQYAEGRVSTPHLIFPTLRTNGGANRIMAGRLINIPSETDTPNYFSVRPSQTGQRGEMLTFIVTNQPVQGLTLSQTPLVLSSEMAELLEGNSDSPAERFELENGLGKTWTGEEKASAASNPRLLTQDDPLPQTVYRVPATPERRAVKLLLSYSGS